MNKIHILCFTLCVLLVCAIAFVACDNSSSNDPSKEEKTTATQSTEITTENTTIDTAPIETETQPANNDSSSVSETTSEETEQTEPHICSGVEWIIYKEVTCTEDGEEHFVCSCGQAVEIKAIPAGHIEEAHDEKEPTCQEIGWDAYVTCGREGCTYTTYSEKAIVDHSYEDHVCIWCEAAEVSTGFVFESNGDGTCILADRGSCNDTVVIIPAVSPDGDVVVGIGRTAFYKYYALTEVIIPDTVTSIGSSAFYQCVNLAKADLPESITSIGKDAFYDCVNVLKWHNNVYYLGKWAVTCSSSDDIIVRGDTVGIADSAIARANRFATVTLEEMTALKYVGDSAFAGCGYLKSVAFPATLKTIGDSAFQGCQRLESITFAPGCELESIGTFAFESTVIKSLQIPANVKVIGDSAFRYCTSLRSVTFEEGSVLETIETAAFINCSSLKSMTIPASVTYIGAYSFSYCPFSDGVTFENTTGWLCTPTNSELLTEAEISAEDLNDIHIAAQYLNDTYSMHYWERTSAEQ